MRQVLVTGASGQIGTELVAVLRARLGADAVTASDLRPPRTGGLAGPYLTLDCTAPDAVDRAVAEGGFDTIFHLAAILSATGEGNPRLAWEVNVEGLRAVLEACRVHGCALFTPSSIAAFGPGTPREPAPQDTLQRPTSMYGITKVTGELLCDYYHLRYGVDARGVRFPGIVSHVAPPGGGTTDWAVEIFHAALKGQPYRCFVGPDTRIDLMYMPDALDAAVGVMEADPARLLHRNAFNVTAMQLTPPELAEAIRRHLPGFVLEYHVDPVRQSIADSWPRRIDDSAAREEWGWCPRFDVHAMTADMLENLDRRLRA